MGKATYMFFVLSIIATKAIPFIVVECGETQAEEDHQFNVFTHHPLSQ